MSLQTQIDELEELLNAGATDIGIGQQRVSIDLDQVRKRLAELKRQQSAAVRPRIASINLGNF